MIVSMAAVLAVSVYFFDAMLIRDLSETPRLHRDHSIDRRHFFLKKMATSSMVFLKKISSATEKSGMVNFPFPT